MTLVAHTALATILAVGHGGNRQPLAPQDVGALSGLLIVGAIWSLSNLRLPSETRWRWGKHGVGRVPVSDFGVIVWALVLLCASGCIFAGGLGATAVASTFEFLIYIGFVLMVAAAFHDYIRAAVGNPPTPPEPPPATPDGPPDDKNA